ncbi:MAG: NmrA/HSCARG family protein [Acidobacteria bacterium]|nr:NmrA/HSCARG family protein [Acidobacteriota bacterium]
MTIPSCSVLVTGSTGKQGGAVVRRLLARGHSVRALTRKPDSAAAHRLRELGVEVVIGSMEDRASMLRATAGVDAVFLVTTPFESGHESECWQGRSVADAAKASGVRHLVYSSVPQARHRTGVPLFEAKASVEAYIQSCGILYTIVAPAFFMENLSGPYYLPGFHEGRFTIPLSPACNLQMISVDDVAAFATLVLEDGQTFHKRRIELASAEHNPEEIAQILTRAMCRKIHYFRTPMQELFAWSKDLAMVYSCLDHSGTDIDIPALVRSYPQVRWQRLQPWAEAQSWGLLVGERVEEVV